MAIKPSVKFTSITNPNSFPVTLHIEIAGIKKNTSNWTSYSGNYTAEMGANETISNISVTTSTTTVGTGISISSKSNTIYFTTSDGRTSEKIRKY